VLTRLADDPRSQAVFEVMQHEAEFGGDMAALTQRKQRERRHCLTHVERVVQQAVTTSQLPRDTDTALAALALHAYIGGIMQSWVLDPTAHDLASSAGVLVDVFINGLRTSPPRIPARKRAGRKPARISERTAISKA
jgi:TetR/AcrR family acrAB operon transcriptional repressor